MRRRRKNPHPKRAVNARTVLKVSCLDARAEEEEKEEPVLCLKIPDEDEVVFEIFEQKEMRKEMTTTTKGVKRKKTQQHECDVCEKVFGYPSQLAVHMRTHTNEKPYECDVCEKRFRHSNALQSHKRIHTNEKPYKCDVCDEAFRDSGHLKTHKRIHTKEKPYECEVCEKRYRQLSGLWYHMRTTQH